MCKTKGFGSTEKLPKLRAKVDHQSLGGVNKTGGFGGDALEDLVDKGAHDGHSLGADTSVEGKLADVIITSAWLPSWILQGST